MQSIIKALVVMVIARLVARLTQWLFLQVDKAAMWSEVRGLVGQSG